MRKLKTTDVFAFMRVVNKAGIRDEIVRMSESVNVKTGKINAKEVGAEVLLNIIANCGDKEAEASIYEFLSGPFETDPKEIGDLDLDVMLEKLKEFADLNKDTLTPFFDSVRALMK